MGRQYQPPANLDRSKVVNLMPQFTVQAELDPTTPVTCLNRGPKMLEDKHDGFDYQIPPHAVFEVSYAAALHLQKRLIVPGTKNPDATDTSMPQYVSWIGIYGIDPAGACEPFTDDELARFGEKTEGLNRDLLPEEDRRVQIVKSAGPAIVSQQAMGGGLGKLRQRVEGGSAEMREHAIAPVDPGTSDGAQATADAIGTGWTPDVANVAPDRSARKPRHLDAPARDVEPGRRIVTKGRK